MEVSVKKLEIKNFQSHENTVLEFNAGINVISGSSNNGKSAILRALQWVITNQPSGNDFITIGKDECIVTLHLSNGTTVTRTKTRSGNVNTYHLKRNGINLSDAPLTGFGSSVPHEVQEAIGITRSEYIFSSQLEAPFLISETPRSRAEKIGNLDELGKIDKALTDVNDDLRFNAKQFKALDTEIKKEQKEIDTLSAEISKETKKVKRINQLHTDLVRESAIAEQISLIIGKWKDIESGIEGLGKICKQAERILLHYPDHFPEKVDEFGRLAEKLNRIIQIEKELSHIQVIDLKKVEAWNALSDEIQTGSTQISSLEKIRNNLMTCKTEFQIASEQVKKKSGSIDVSPLEVEIDRYRKISDIKAKLSTALKDITETTSILNQAETSKGVLVDELVNWLQTEQKCPVCAQGTQHIHLNPDDII